MDCHTYKEHYVNSYQKSSCKSFTTTGWHVCCCYYLRVFSLWYWGFMSLNGKHLISTPFPVILLWTFSGLFLKETSSSSLYPIYIYIYIGIGRYFGSEVGLISVCLYKRRETKKVGFLQYESKINAIFKKKFCLPTETVDFWNVFEYEQLCNMSLNQLETEKIKKNKQNIFIMFILD